MTIVEKAIAYMIYRHIHAALKRRPDLTPAQAAQPLLDVYGERPDYIPQRHNFDALVAQQIEIVEIERELGHAAPPVL